MNTEEELLQELSELIAQFVGKKFEEASDQYEIADRLMSVFSRSAPSYGMAIIKALVRDNLIPEEPANKTFQNYLKHTIDNMNLIMMASKSTDKLSEVLEKLKEIQ